MQVNGVLAGNDISDGAAAGLGLLGLLLAGHFVVVGRRLLLVEKVESRRADGDFSHPVSAELLKLQASLGVPRPEHCHVRFPNLASLCFTSASSHAINLYNK